MHASHQVVFGPFRLDLRNEQLWDGEQAVPLKPKTMAVLCYLAERPGQLVTKEELLAAVWTEVDDALLKICIREIRQALRDTPRTPQYIETVHRRGYRFIAAVSSQLSAASVQPLETTVQTVPETRPDKKIERKLAAILSADVQGYSRLMGEDEAATIRMLSTYREVMTRLIQQHRGRVVNAPGDNLLAEFASAVDAVEGAVAIQRELQTRNAKLPATRQMVYRIGINVGDVVVEDEQIYGEAVNITARLESLAEGGGICISDATYNQVKTKVALAYTYMGKRQVKNIAEPVRAYRIQLEPEAVAIQSPLSPSPLDLRPHQQAAGPGGTRRGRLPEGPPQIVGREAELVQLYEALETARSEDRRIIFVTGEAGIGKTTLVETFLNQIASREEVWIGQGQCIEHYGAGEAYLPMLEALGRLCREPEGERLLELLHQHAPTWLVQMPALLNATELEALQRRVLGATRERMLREMAEAIEALTQERLVMLRFEDLHWSDPSTLDLIAYLARRPGPARLLVLGTYRPVDVIVGDHPLRTVKRELQLHGHCEELRLEFLTEAAVEEYLTRRFAVGATSWLPGHEFVQTIHQRTEGNPLFMVTVVNDLVTQGVLTQRDGQWELGGELAAANVPAGLQQFIEQQIEWVSPEAQRVLEAASVAGMDFSAAAVAAALEAEVEEVEKRCEELSRREQFLHAGGVSEWPDGTVAARYGFIHALYQEVLYERVPAAQRMNLHQRIGERAESAYGQKAREIAAELVMHFEQARDFQRAIQYLQQAGENALRRSAHQEAITHFTKGLELLATVPDTMERARQELVLQIALGVPLTATKGYAAPEVEQLYARARELCQLAGETPHLFPALLGLYGFYLVRAELSTARELGELSLSLAERTQDPTLLMLAHGTLGSPLFFLGELLRAQEHLEQGIALYDFQQHRSYTLLYGNDAGVARLSYASWTLWFLGYPDQALSRISEALNLAQRLGDPFNRAFVLCFTTWLHQLRRDENAAQEHAEALIALSHEQGFPFWLAHGIFLRGWALVEQGYRQEGIQQMREGEAGHAAIGARIGLPLCLALLAEACGKVGRTEEGIEVQAEAVATVHSSEARYYEAELYRLKGELLLNDEGGTMNDERRAKQAVEAEAGFQQAIDIARRQSAKSLELRTVMSLSRLWQQQGKREEARQILAEIYAWFTEGFDTKDLQEAKALLEGLA